MGNNPEVIKNGHQSTNIQNWTTPQNQQSINIKMEKRGKKPTKSIIIRPQKAYDYIKQIAASTGRRRHLPKKQENMSKFPKLWYNSKKGNAFKKG